MINKLISGVIEHKDTLAYINLNENNTYNGWTTNFNITLPGNEKMSLNLSEECDLFLLFVLASSWSKTGPWENAAYFTTYLKHSKKHDINLWLVDEFVESEIKNRMNQAENIVSISKGVNSRKKISFRKDYYFSVAILAENWDEINSILNQSSKTGNYVTFIEYLNGIRGLGAGNNRMRIKILLILRELRCQRIYDNIPGELCCVPDARVLKSAQAVGIKLPRITSMDSILKASKIIYRNFGDLYDIPLFAYEDANGEK